MIQTKSLTSGLIILALASFAHGGTWLEEFLITSPADAADASSGISTSKIYTHAVDWATDDGGAVVNGVVFGEGGTFGSNYTLDGTNNVFQNNPANSFHGASGMFDLNDDFFFTGPGAPNQILTLTGLTGGQTYTISHYLSQGWAGAIQDLDGDDDGFGFEVYSTDRGDASAPKVIRYTYTQAPDDTDFQMTFVAQDGANGFHHYSFTNEVIPEPGSAALLGLGALSLLARRRRA